jgi:hypothetical protein
LIAVFLAAPRFLFLIKNHGLVLLFGRVNTDNNLIGDKVPFPAIKTGGLAASRDYEVINEKML